MIAEALQEVLQVLGEQFGTTGVALWAILVKQQVVNGIATITATVVVGAVTLGALIVEYNSKHPAWGDAESMSAWVAFFGSITFVILMGVTIFSGIPHLLNPEYYALTELKGLLP